MMSPPVPARRPPCRHAARPMLALIFCLAIAHAADAAQGLSGAPEPVAAPAARFLTVNLAECLRIANQRQPRIAAQRASLAAAEDGSRALDNLQIPTLLVPELAFRRRQAALGVVAATAAVDQAERETVYAVTRSYFTVLFAREQERVTQAIVARLGATRDAAQRALDAGAKDVSDSDVKRGLVYLRLAEAKQVEANQGVKRALAALREAIGLGPDIMLDVPAARLPDVAVHPTRHTVVAQALAHRGELTNASVFAEAAALEVKAQGASLHKRTETFAAGSDIHSFLVSPGVMNSEYRPAGVPPEMPAILVGSCHERMKRAQSLAARAQAVTEATSNLIALEADDAFLRWEEAWRQIPKAREAADTGDKVAEDLGKDFAAGLKVRVEEVISARLLAAQARAQYNEYLYRQALALADLERVTGGAFCARLVEAIAPPPVPTKGGGAP
jgi:outer membrane protein TolC